jgi:hypothetical protein
MRLRLRNYNPKSIFLTRNNRRRKTNSKSNSKIWLTRMQKMPRTRNKSKKKRKDNRTYVIKNSEIRNFKQPLKKMLKGKNSRKKKKS